MKRLFLALAILSNAALLNAQGTLFFTANFSGANEVPPNASAGLASGSFEVIDPTLYVSVLVYSPLKAADVTINGSANPGTIAPVLFDLPMGVIIAPDPQTGQGGQSYTLAQNLTASQIADLEAGKWYVNIDTAAYPNGELRGQLVPVPEPSSISLFGLGCPTSPRSEARWVVSRTGRTRRRCCSQDRTISFSATSVRFIS